MRSKESVYRTPHVHPKGVAKCVSRLARVVSPARRGGLTARPNNQQPSRTYDRWRECSLVRVVGKMSHMTGTDQSAQSGGRAVIYARVSADDQRKGRSVGQQEDECRAAARDAAVEVIDVFKDNDRSASRYSRRIREGHRDLLSFLATGCVDMLILWEPSRGDRELERWAGLLNLCRRRGIRIHVVVHRRTYDLDNARDWRTLAEDGVDSAYESEKTRERIMRHVRDNAAKGRPHGKLLYGYRRIYDDRGNYVEQVPHEGQAPVVQEAASRIRAGESLYAVARDFNERGITAPRGGSWLPMQIRRLVLNPGYVARRVHQGTVVGAAEWPALVDEQTHAECASRLNDPRRRTNRDTSIRHLLSGTARCGVCGAGMRIQNNRGNLSYMCPAKFCTAVKKSKLDGHIEDMIRARLKKPDGLAILVRHHGSSNEDSLAAMNEAAALRSRLEEFYVSAAAGKLSPAGLASVEVRLLPQIEAAEKLATAAPIPEFMLGSFGENPELPWDDMVISQQREVVARLADVRVGPTVRGTRTFDPRRLGQSRWIGETRTWGEIWKEGSHVD